MTRLIFLDTETTSLDRRERLIWDIGYIIRGTHEDGTHWHQERQFFVQVDLENADPESLEIGRYRERMGHSPISEESMCRQVAHDFSGAIIIGAIPSFDEETLAQAFHRHGIDQTWHYHLIDIESMAAGLLALEPPWDFDRILEEFGLRYNELDRHTAIGDARMVRDLYDSIMIRPRTEPVYPLEHSQVMLRNVHNALRCSGRACTIHNRTNHVMRQFPQYFREDTGIIERVCPHGIGHPDPDSPDWTDWVHGCDGCCQVRSEEELRAIRGAMVRNE